MLPTTTKLLSQQAFELAVRVSNFHPDSDQGRNLAEQALAAEIALFEEVAITGEFAEGRERAKRTAEHLRQHGRRYTTKLHVELGEAA